MTDIHPPAVPQLAIPTLAPRLEGEQLEEAVLKQIDYYFSRQNLANDAYLVSQMDADMWVPIATIAGFKKVHMLTSDVDLIARIMSKSQNVVVDSERKTIKPSWKLQRNTLILRDIPADAPADEVRQIFRDKFTITAAHADIGNTWFVSFPDEETAIAALDFIREANLTFRDAPVKARIKSEHLLKSGGVAPVMQYADPYAQFRAYAPQAYGGARAPYPPYWEGQQDNGKGGDRRGGYRGGARPPRNPAASPQGAAAPATQTQAQPTTQGPRTPRGGQGGYKPDAQVAAGAPAADGRRGRKGGKSKKLELKPQFINGIAATPTVIVPDFSHHNFPSLPSPPANGKVHKSGYETEFRQFTKTDILRIISNVKDVSTRPDTIIHAEAGVVDTKPNTELEIAKEHALERAPEPAAPATPTAPAGAVREWPEKRPVQVFVPKKEAAPSTPAPAPAPTSPSGGRKETAELRKESTELRKESAEVRKDSAELRKESAELRKESAELRRESAELRKEAEKEAAHPPAPNAQPATSPSLSSSSEGNGIRIPSYADIALGLSRTNSPPIAKPVSPNSAPSSPNLSSSSSSSHVASEAKSSH